MCPRITEILKTFGKNNLQVRRPEDAKLAQVYFVEDRYVLRSRSLGANTISRFTAECNLCEKVADLTGYHFPQYERCNTGKRYLIKDDYFWTLHKLIPGKPLGSWFELHRLDPSINRQVLNALRRLHNMTSGCFESKHIDRSRLIELVTPALNEAPSFLSEKALNRLWDAINKVSQYCESYTTEAGCFVHGDFHHGNILAYKNRIIGFIDLDWCRISSLYEDLAFTLMMLMRDYRNWSHSFQWSKYYQLLDYYRFKGNINLLNDHLILYTLFDCDVFKSASFDDAGVYLKYQKIFLETLCQNLSSTES